MTVLPPDALLDAKPPDRWGLPVGTLLTALFALFAVDNLLLLTFLGRGGVPAIVMGLGVIAGLLWSLRRTLPREAWVRRVGWPTLGIALGLALLLCVLGGQGRFLYANADWQIRDAVLFDMGRGAWPFTYLLPDGEAVLRAPIGLYLRPALFGAGGQAALDMALLLNTAILLGLLLALAAAMFPTARGRVIAFTLFLTVGGLDILGTAMVAGRDGNFDHLDMWLWKLQYSATPTLIFWVPQHAIAGWAVALIVLLHRLRLASIGAVAAIVPLVALWSPFAVMGALPIVGWVGLCALRDRRVTRRDVAVAAIAVVVALPALVYLRAGSDAVGFGWTETTMLGVMLLILFEVVPILWLVRRLRWSGRWGRDLIVIAALMLLLLPLGRLGTGIDFVARVSIVPLALLIATIAAGAVADDRLGRRDILAILLVSLAAVTGVAEVHRALVNRPAPPPQCSLATAWVQQSGPKASIRTYAAPVDTLPLWLRPVAARTIDARNDPAQCWERPWTLPR